MRGAVGGAGPARTPGGRKEGAREGKAWSEKQGHEGRKEAAAGHSRAGARGLGGHRPQAALLGVSFLPSDPVTKSYRPTVPPCARQRSKPRTLHLDGGREEPGFCFCL